MGRGMKSFLSPEVKSGEEAMKQRSKIVRKSKGDQASYQKWTQTTNSMEAIKKEGT